jgi:hypothetical protein
VRASYAPASAKPTFASRQCWTPATPREGLEGGWQTYAPVGCELCNGKAGLLKVRQGVTSLREVMAGTNE